MKHYYVFVKIVLSIPAKNKMAISDIENFLTVKMGPYLKANTQTLHTVTSFLFSFQVKKKKKRWQFSHAQHEI